MRKGKGSPLPVLDFLKSSWKKTIFKINAMGLVNETVRARTLILTW